MHYMLVERGGTMSEMQPYWISRLPEMQRLAARFQARLDRGGDEDNQPFILPLLRALLKQAAQEDQGHAMSRMRRNRQGPLYGMRRNGGTALPSLQRRRVHAKEV